MTILRFGVLGDLFDGPHATPQRTDSGPYFLNIASLVDGRLDLSLSDHVSEAEFTQWTRRVTPQSGDLLFSYWTRLGDAALMPDNVRACLGRRMALLRPNRNVVDPQFLLYYYLSPTMKETIARNTIHGATVNRIGLSTMGEWPVVVPALAEQQSIAEVLGALDDKIVANAMLRDTLKRHLSLEIELAVGSGCAPTRLGNVVEFHNRRRVPLSARERDQRLGSVPYYGATGRFGFVDQAIFDEKLVLVGEDGSVVTDDGHPVVQYVWGPAWVNNHAHVLTGVGVSTELLLILIERADVRALVTGAVQPKLSMGNLRALGLQVPHGDGLDRIERLCAAEMAIFRSLSEESVYLTSMRDLLLPSLMSGKLRVKDAEKQLEAVV